MSSRPLKRPDSSPFLFFFAAAASFEPFFSPASSGDSRSAATATEVFLVAAKIHPGDCVDGDASPVPVGFVFSSSESFLNERERE